ncbi:MAG TPA: hypothetical protein VHD36_20165 [Pirellulales bacterium]|nr:hypothetical protein [Pirellulales bacterium]
MYPYTDAYHLRSGDVQDGIALLRRAGLRGYVFPPENGWVCVLPEGPWGRPAPDLLDANVGYLLRMVVTELCGWHVELFDGPTCISAICASKSVASVEATWPNVLAFSTRLGLDIDISARLDELTSGDFEQASPASMNLLADLIQQLGLRQTPWLNYEEATRIGKSSHLESTIIVEKGPPDESFLRARRREWVVPDGMFGTHASVGAWADKLVLRMLQANDLQDVLQSEPNTQTIPDYLFVENPPIWLRKRENCWRPYVIHEALFRARPRGQNVNMWSEFGNTLIAAMNHDWFTLGMLGQHAFTDILRSILDSNCSITIVLLEQYLNWMPQFERCSRRIQTGSSYCGTVNRRPHWAHCITRVALSSKWKIPRDRFLKQTHDVLLLVETGAIEHTEHGYKTTTAFREAVRSAPRGQ